MPNEPGSLHQAAAVMKRFQGNIERIQYDQRIDPHTVFFEVLIEPEQFQKAMDELAAIGHLRRTLPEPVYLKFEVQIPHQEGALFDFLDSITSTRSNIAFLDFDVTGGEPDTLKVGIVIDDQSRAEELLDIIKGRYPLRITEYRTSGDDLDDTVFYVRFAQDLRALIPEVDDQFLLRFLSDVNHIMQSLRRLGQDHREVFQSILDSGRYLRQTSGTEFFCDLQTMVFGEGTLHCLQLPCGGNVYLIQNEQGVIMVDSGYGHYHEDLVKTLEWMGIGKQDVQAILLTHADADHYGSAGSFQCPTYLSSGSDRILKSQNRAQGSSLQSSVLENYYTRMINLFSDCRPPTRTIVFSEDGNGHRGKFKITQTLDLLNLKIEVLQGMDGHVPGQTFFFLPQSQILFSSDSLIHFRGLSEERRRYMSLAKVLMTSVNVDSVRAVEEREALEALTTEHPHLIICGGHGPMFRYEGGGMVTVETVKKYRHPSVKAPDRGPGK